MSYRRTPRTEAKKADRRRKLLTVAQQIVADGGFQLVQIATVADLAGIAHGTVYRYFPSKADLCAEVYRRFCDREIAVAMEVADSGGPAGERLRAVITAVVGRALRGRKVAYALIAEPVDPLVDAERLVYRRALAEVFEGIIRDGIANGELPAQQASVASACILGATMEALVSPWTLVTLELEGMPRRDTEAELLRDVTAFCLRAVGLESGEGQGSREAV